MFRRLGWSVALISVLVGFLPAAARARPARVPRAVFAADDEDGIAFTAWWNDLYDGTAPEQAMVNVADTGAGWVSVPTTWYQPTITSAVDLQEQADCYQAAFAAVSDEPWFAGMFWWDWSSDPTVGGALDDGYAPFGKPAEDVLRAWY
jgi:hypothetical protein